MPALAHQEQQVAHVLDPLRLFHQVQDLQQALFVLTTSVSPEAEVTYPVAILPFCTERCIAGSLAAATSESGVTAGGILWYVCLFPGTSYILSVAIL